jgi:type IV pilus assembly protein PilV
MRRVRGYTVIEVMMALAVLTLGASGVIAMEKATLLANTNARNMAVATMIAQSWIERVRADAQAWNDQGGTSDFLNDTIWLKSAGTVPPMGGAGWFTPVGVATLSNFPAGQPAADVMGADPALLDPYPPAFCTQLRLTRFATSPTDPLASVYRVVRVEVRVFWDRARQPMPVTCAGIPGGTDAEGNAEIDITSDTGRYGSVYLVSSAMENASPF